MILNFVSYWYILAYDMCLGRLVVVVVIPIYYFERTDSLKWPNIVLCVRIIYPTMQGVHLWWWTSTHTLILYGISNNILHHGNMSWNTRVPNIQFGWSYLGCLRFLGLYSFHWVLRRMLFMFYSEEALCRCYTNNIFVPTK